MDVEGLGMADMDRLELGGAFLKVSVEQKGFFFLVMSDIVNELVFYVGSAKITPRSISNLASMCQTNRHDSVVKTYTVA